MAAGCSLGIRVIKSKDGAHTMAGLTHAVLIKDIEAKADEDLEKKLFRLLSDWAVYDLESRYEGIRKRLRKRLAREIVIAIVGFNEKEIFE